MKRKNEQINENDVTKIFNSPKSIPQFTKNDATKIFNSPKSIPQFNENDITKIFNSPKSITQLNENDITKIFNSPKSITQFRGNNTSRNNKLKGTFTIYTVETLPTLIEKIRLSAPGKEEITLRFLLTTDYKLLFAREGAPNAYIPAHFAMTGQGQQNALCITAGNIIINAENEIIFVNHKSGDFKPSWDSLRHGLYALLACNVAFSKTIQIEHLYKEVYMFALDDLKKELDGTFTDQQIQDCKQVNANLKEETHRYPITANYPTQEDTLSKNEKAQDQDYSPLKNTFFSGKNSRLEKLSTNEKIRIKLTF